MSYQIVSGNEKEKFALRDGALLVATSLADVSGKFVIEVEALDNDNGELSHTSIENAFVTIDVKKMGSNSVQLRLRMKTIQVVNRKVDLEL